MFGVNTSGGRKSQLPDTWELLLYFFFCRPGQAICPICVLSNTHRTRQNWGNICVTKEQEYHRKMATGLEEAITKICLKRREKNNKQFFLFTRMAKGF